MARLFSTGGVGMITTARSYLSSSAGPFTLAFWMQATNNTQTNRYIAQAYGAGQWAPLFGYAVTGDDRQVEFFIGGGSGDPRTGSQITILDGDVGNWVHIIYRYKGASDEWSYFKDGAQTVINSSITFVLPTVATGLAVGSNSAGAGYLGSLAEFAIWSVALSDNDCAELAHGVAPDMLPAAVAALEGYWPLRGNNSPEPDYTSNAADLTITSGAQSAHVTVNAPLVQQTSERAWVLDLYHANGTVTAASTDLAQEKDYDVLGAQYPKHILNAADIRVVHELTDGFYGVDLPSTTTVICANPGYHYPAVVMGHSPVAYWPLGEASSPTADDRTDNSIDLTYSAVQLGVTGGLKHNTGTAADFDGTSAYAYVADNDLLDITGDLTLEAWVKFDVTTGTQTLLSKGYLAPFCYQWTLNAGVMQLTHATGTIYGIAATTGPTAGSWQHLAVTRSGSTVTHYINGEPVGGGTISGSAGANSEQFRISGHSGGAELVDGAVQHAAIYNTALTATQIKSHYLAGQDARAAFDPTTEWREVRATLRRYDRVSHELVSELSGQVVDTNFQTGRVAFTIADRNPSLLDTLIPRQLVNVDDFPSATDLGAPLPIVFGSSAFLSAAPYVGRDEEDTVSDASDPAEATYDDGANPGGRDFIVSHRRDASNALMDVRVEHVFQDNDADVPGLEQLTSWAAAPGTPTYADATHFTVNSAAQYSYYGGTVGVAGPPVRVKSGGGTVWQYTFVSSGYNAGTVTLADSVLSNPIDSMQLAGDYIVENGRYEVPSGKEFLSVRILEGDEGAMVVQASNTSITNPADVIKEILTNSQWGLADKIHATSFSDAATAFTNAGLGSAVRGPLGDKKQQRRAGDVISELAFLRGARVYYDADAQAWKISVDSAPSAAQVTLGLDDGQYNNVKRIESTRRANLAQTISTLRFHYARLPRTRSAADIGGTPSLIPTEHQWYIEASLRSVGTEHSISSPWIRTYSEAARVLAYHAKRFLYADKAVTLVCGQEGRRLSLGDLVGLVSPQHGIDADYRVRRIERRLGDVRLDLEGYDASIYTFSSPDDSGLITAPRQQAISGSNTEADLDGVDRRARIPGAGTNLIRNSDFTTGTRIATVDADMLPYWTVGGQVSALAVSTSGTDATQSAGGAVLSITSSGTGAPSAGIASGAWGGFNPDAGGIVVMPGKVYVLSVYCDSDSGWRLQFTWYRTNGTSISTISPPLRVNPGDLNGKGWSRYYVRGRAPTEAAYVAAAILCDQATGTYQFDAVQLEPSGRRSHRPTQWKRDTRWGIDPAQVVPGALTIRPSGEAEHGMKLWTATKHVTSITAGASFSIPTDDDGDPIIPSNSALMMVTGRITETIALSGGGTAINVGDSTLSDRFAHLLSPTSGSTFNLADHDSTFAPGHRYSTAGTIILAPDAGTFTGGTGNGQIQVTAHYIVGIGPTA